jgi:uncharacterized membrane protein YjjP (DUF1212 family)
MQVGDCLLSAGMSANDVVVAMLGITDAYGLTRVHVDVTYTSISASCYPARGAAPITCIRVVQPDDIDYSKVRDVGKLTGRSGAVFPSAKPPGHSIASRRLRTDTRSGWR